MIQQALFKLASSNPNLKKAALSIVADAAPPEEGEAESTTKKKKGPPPGWDKFLGEKYQGGKAKVQNPNAKTRESHPQVSVSTALKTKSFMDKVMKEYAAWMKKDKGSKSKAPSEPKKEEPKKEDKPSKPEPAPYRQALLPQVTDRLDFGSKWNRSSLSSEDKYALSNYTGEGYVSINKALRTDPGDLPSYLKGTVDTLRKTMKPPKGGCPEEVTAFRTTDKSHPLYQGLVDGTIKPGAKFKDKGFMSTTVSPGFNFVKFNVFKMEIFVPKGTPSIYVGRDNDYGYLSEHPNEDELILDAGTEVEIVSFDSDKGVVKCRVVK